MPEKAFKCPVCGKPLTEDEFDQALGLWKEKQEHIKHHYLCTFPNASKLKA